MTWAFVGGYFATARGHMDASHAVGRDFVNVWTAGQLLARGQVLDIFDPARFLAAERALFDPRLPLHFWSYPPTALFLAAPLAGLGYFAAYALWTIAGLVALALAGAAFFRDRRDCLWLLVSPAVAVNLVLGQNGALSAAALLGGFAVLARSSLNAGVLWGLLSIKPHLGLLLPVAMIATRNWTVIATMAGTTVALIAVSIGAFGWDAWRAFFALTLPMQTEMMANGVGPFQAMMPTIFMSGRLLGLPSTGALVLQGVGAMLAVLLVWRVYRQPDSWERQAAMLLTATFLASPQGFNYDMIPVAAAALYLSRAACSRADHLLAGLLWLAPLLVMPLNAVHVPVMPVVLFLAVLRLAAGGERFDRSG